VGGVFTGRHRPYFDDAGQRSQVQDVAGCVNTACPPWSDYSNGVATVQGTDRTYGISLYIKRGKVSVLWCGDGAGNTFEENSSVFSLIRMQ